MKSLHVPRLRVGVLCALLCSLCLDGQIFNSGSTGTDGALSLTTPGTVLFDPNALGLHPAVPNVFNFTTITIGTGVTVTLTSKVLTGPVYWLAQGAVKISGVVDASGESGASVTNNIVDRVAAAGGAGGYSGGLGGGSTLSPTAGNGPGGSPGTTTNGQQPGVAFGGQFTGSQYLIPLIGGSGGGGSVPACDTYGAEGGAGGGALLLASSTSITLTGATISAAGGSGGNPCSGVSPGGSGGAIRFMAPAISADAPSTITVSGGSYAGGDGVIRLESFSLTNNASTHGRLVTSVPFAPAVPTTAPSSLKVTSVNSIPINANPFTFPDVTINSSAAVTVAVQAQYIPTGTIPKIIVSSETGLDQSVSCSPLQGTLQQSTCTASIPFPTGGARGLVKATW